ncbi:MAG: M50 family metallopeptidase [Acidimicrobiales bacterium]
MTQTQTQTGSSSGDRGDSPDPGDQVGGLLRLGLVVLGGMVAAVATGVTSTVLVVLAIVVMIMLHELGHFATAKWAGMKVTEYFLGFGPRLWSIRKGDTEYGVKAIPAGGYVRIIGMSNLDKVDPEDEHRTYRQKPYWRRLSVAVAGSTVHFILAFILLFSIFAFVGVENADQPNLEVGTISRLESGPSPAQQAGFEVGDRLLAVDGRPLEQWEDIPPYIWDRPGEEIVFTVERAGRELDLTATPIDLSKVRIGDGTPLSSEPKGFVGVGPTFPVEKFGLVESAGKSFTGLGRATVDTVKALGSIFSPDGASSYGRQLAGGESDPEEGDPRFLSPVGFARVASQAADTGVREVLALLFMINVFVGLFNMIPLLPLDGGHVIIATYEKIRSRKGRPYHADVAKAMPIYYMFFLVLVFIGASSLYLDIVRPIANPFE